MKLSKLVGLILAGACVVLVGVGAMLASGVGSSISGDVDVAVAEQRLADNDGAEPVELDLQESDIDVVSQRPLFDEGRIPVIEDETAAIEEGAEAMEIEPVELDVDVKGIIIAPNLRLAIVTDKRNNERSRVREGMPLEDDLAGWTLTEVQPRELKFDGEGMGEAVVELVTDTKGAPAPIPDTAPTAESSEQADAEEPDEAENTSLIATDEDGRPTFRNNPDSAAQAEEIRRRVAERRAQLQAEAERRRAEQNRDR